MLTEKEDAWHTKMNSRYKAEKQQSILLRLELQLIGERIFGTFFSLLGLGIEKISMHYFLEKRSYLHYNILFPAFQAGNKKREVCVKESEKLMEKLGIHGYFK